MYGSVSDKTSNLTVNLRQRQSVRNRCSPSSRGGCARGAPEVVPAAVAVGGGGLPAPCLARRWGRSLPGKRETDEPGAQATPDWQHNGVRVPWSCGAPLNEWAAGSLA